jgi:hypothetical protein
MADMLLADINHRQTSDGQWMSGFAPAPLTYINGDRWEDECVSRASAGDAEPKTQEQWEKWAAGNGIEAKIGESWSTFLRRAKNSYEAMA